MVLAGDTYTAAGQLFDRVVGAVVPELHLKSLGARGQRHDLVAQANPKCRDTGFNQLRYCRNRVRTRLRVARSVAQKNTVRLQGLDCLG